MPLTCAVISAITYTVSLGINRPVIVAAQIAIPIGIGELISIGIGIIGIPRARHIVLSIWCVIPIKERIGLQHPKGILIILFARTGSPVEGLQIAITAVREIAVSVFRTSSMVNAIGLQSVSRNAATTAAHAYGSRWTHYHQEQRYKCKCNSYSHDLPPLVCDYIFCPIYERFLVERREIFNLTIGIPASGLKKRKGSGRQPRPLILG
jgi:hypothetical protein